MKTNHSHPAKAGFTVDEIMPYNNNQKLKKLLVALELKKKEVRKIMILGDFEPTKSEVDDYFRGEDTTRYHSCPDRAFDAFLDGLIIYKRGKKDEQK